MCWTTQPFTFMAMQKNARCIRKWVSLNSTLGHAPNRTMNYLREPLGPEMDGSYLGEGPRRHSPYLLRWFVLNFRFDPLENFDNPKITDHWEIAIGLASGRTMRDSDKESHLDLEWKEKWWNFKDFWWNALHLGIWTRTPPEMPESHESFHTDRSMRLFLSINYYL